MCGRVNLCGLYHTRLVIASAAKGIYLCLCMCVCMCLCGGFFYLPCSKGWMDTLPCLGESGLVAYIIPCEVYLVHAYMCRTLILP